MTPVDAAGHACGLVVAVCREEAVLCEMRRSALTECGRTRAAMVQPEPCYGLSLKCMLGTEIALCTEHEHKVPCMQGGQLSSRFEPLRSCDVARSHDAHWMYLCALTTPVLNSKHSMSMHNERCGLLTIATDLRAKLMRRRHELAHLDPSESCSCNFDKRVLAVNRLLLFHWTGSALAESPLACRCVKHLARLSIYSAAAYGAKAASPAACA